MFFIYIYYMSQIDYNINLARLSNQPVKNYDNVYSSNNVPRVRKQINNLAKQRYIAAKDPKKTGVIPALYNKKKDTRIKQSLDDDSDFSDDSEAEHFNSNNGVVDDSAAVCGNTIDLNNPACFIKASDDILNNSKYERKYMEKTKERNNYLSQFDTLTYDNPSVPVSSNGIPQTTRGNSAKIELERSMAIDGGYSNFNSNSDMAYGVIGQEDFTHNNMVPSFSNRTGAGFDPLHESKLANNSQRRLDHFSGSINDIAYRPKTEHRKLFNPTANQTNIFGTPVMTDYYESRYIPSNERRSELPFQQVKVTPGIGLGANEQGTHGFHDTFRSMPKNVDELRVKGDAQKSTYTAPINHGMKGNHGPIVGKQFKYRPLTYKEERVEDMLPSKSYFNAPAIYGKFDPNTMATVNRGVNETEHFGPAKLFNDQILPADRRAEVRTDVKQQYKHAEPTNTQRQEGKDARGHDNSFDPKITQRDQKQSYIGPAGVNELSRLYAYDNVNAIPDDTMRNIHDKLDRAGQMGNRQLDKTYVYDTLNIIPDNTKRDIHDKPDRAGQLGNNQLNKNYVYDNINAIPENTKRDIHDKPDRAGQMGNNQLNKHYVYDDINMIPENTKRDIHDKPDRAGQMGNNQLNKHYVYDDINMIPDNTKRNIHDKLDRAGQMGNGELEKHYVYDNINAIPENTKRDIHGKTDRAGQMGNNQLNKHYTYDNINMIPDNTKRDIHDKPGRAGNAMGFHEAQRNRGDVNNMRTNTAKEIIAQGRAPTTSNYNKGPTIDFTVVTLKEPINNNREVYPENKDYAKHRIIPTTTTLPQKVPQYSWHFYSYVDDNLIGNPYINNIVHKSPINKIK